MKFLDYLIGKSHYEDKDKHQGGLSWMTHHLLLLKSLLTDANTHAPIGKTLSLEDVKANRELIGNQTVLIWSGEYKAWWKNEYSGYTNHRNLAGRYSFRDAFENTCQCDPSKGILFEIL